jgi:hypothetical protein
MTFLDEIDVDYEYIMEMDPDEQNTALLNLANDYYFWEVKTRCWAIEDEFHPKDDEELVP